MLNGKELGQAIGKAISLKLASGTVKNKTQIAKHFEVRLPSLYDWVNKGSISKDKLEKLWRFFSDVVGPEHWGLEKWPEWNPDQQKTNVERLDALYVWGRYQAVEPAIREVIDFLLQDKNKPRPPWVDVDARAYVDSLETKARKWIDCKSDGDAQTKTGT
jgi:hypothetical protein